MTTLASEIKASIQWLFQEPLALTTVGDASQLAYDDTLASGTAADEADRIWSDERTLAAGANDDLNLTALAHAVFGSTVSINLARVKAILIVHTSTTAGEKLQLDSSVVNGFTGPFAGSATSKLEIGADSAALLASKKDGWATASNNKVLRIHNAGSSPATYRIVVLGTSA
jgi:hypothetical protein